MAFRVVAVSINDSPLRTELVPTCMLMVSAPRRLAASSNDVRVRVEFSKNRFITVRPRSRLVFLSGRRLKST